MSFCSLWLTDFRVTQTRVLLNVDGFVLRFCECFTTSCYILCAVLFTTFTSYVLTGATNGVLLLTGLCTAQDQVYKTKTREAGCEITVEVAVMSRSLFAFIMLYSMPVKRVIFYLSSSNYLCLLVLWQCNYTRVWVLSRVIALTACLCACEWANGPVHCFLAVMAWLVLCDQNGCVRRWKRRLSTAVLWNCLIKPIWWTLAYTVNWKITTMMNLEAQFSMACRQILI